MTISLVCRWWAGLGGWLLIDTRRVAAHRNDINNILIAILALCKSGFIHLSQDYWMLFSKTIYKNTQSSQWAFLQTIMINVDIFLVYEKLLHYKWKTKHSAASCPHTLHCLLGDMPLHIALRALSVHNALRTTLILYKSLVPQ